MFVFIPCLALSWPAAYLLGARSPFGAGLRFAVLFPPMLYGSMNLMVNDRLREPALWGAAAVSWAGVILLRCWRLRSSTLSFDRGDDPLPRRLR